MSVSFVEMVGEVIGVFVFFSCIFMLTSKSQSNSPLLLTAVGIGLALALGIVVSSVTGSKSFLNPAVALSMLLNNNIDAVQFLGYTCAEIVGACLAVLYVKGSNLV